MALHEAETLAGNEPCVCPEDSPSALCPQHSHLLLSFWTHPQLAAEEGESEDEYLERFSEFMFVNEGREIRGLE